MIFDEMKKFLFLFYEIDKVIKFQVRVAVVSSYFLANLTF